MRCFFNLIIISLLLIIISLLIMILISLLIIIRILLLLLLILLLCASHPAVLDGGAAVSQGDLGGGGAELGQAEDGQVLVVQAGVLHDEPLHLLHHRQHPRLAVIGAVSWSDTERRSSAAVRRRTSPEGHPGPTGRRRQTNLTHLHLYGLPTSEQLKLFV